MNLTANSVASQPVPQGEARACAPEDLLDALRLLAAAGRSGRRQDDAVVVVDRQRDVSVSVGTFPLDRAGALIAGGLARWGGGRRPDLVITQQGRALLEHAARAALATAGPVRRETALVEIAGETVTVNVAESPLAWLRRRKDAAGTPFIDASAFAAGERLRRDLTSAAMLPRMSMDWSAEIRSGNGAAGVGMLEPERTTDARARVRRTLDAVGPEFAGLLIDLCGFLKGLESIERERNWPARSGKVVLRLALSALARHYGIAAVAEGRSQAPLGAWAARDSRPAFPR